MWGNGRTCFRRTGRCWRRLVPQALLERRVRLELRVLRGRKDRLDLRARPELLVPRALWGSTFVGFGVRRRSMR
jgi:hypothetical protein